MKKCQYILEEDEECRNLFSRGSFKVSYRRSHKNLKELLAPSKIALSEESGREKQPGDNIRENARNVKSVGKQLEIESDVQVFIHVKCLKKTRCLEVLRQGKGLKLGKI